MEGGGKKGGRVREAASDSIPISKDTGKASWKKRKSIDLYGKQDKRKCKRQEVNENRI